MFSSQFYFVIICFTNVLCLQKKLCGNDEECLINAVIERVYPRFVAGMPGVETSDPLHLDAIVTDLPSIRYSLYNATLTGLKNCEFVRLDNKRINTYTFFDYAVTCPLLILQAQYNLNGIIDDEPIEGKGDCKIMYDNYLISISGKHEKVADDKGKLHVNIIDYSVHPDLSHGNVKKTEYFNLNFSDSCNNQAKIIEESTRDIVMDIFMNKYIQNLKNFHRLVPVEDLHFKYVP